MPNFLIKLNGKVNDEEAENWQVRFKLMFKKHSQKLMKKSTFW
mgnify:CR=1 FL=1